MPRVSEEAEPLNMESMGHPEIYPLVLTTKTQEIFNCRVEEDVTEEQPYKLIKKEDIFADFANRAAVSDFYPVKNIVQEYPGDELLLVYDRDFKYGLNFYLIGTEEGKENYLNPPELPEEQEEYKDHIPEETYIYKPPISKPWISMGSEKEIEEESVKDSTKQITYMISRKRSEFGAPIKFSDQNASSVKDAYIECTAYPDKNFTLKQLERDVGMQVVPQIKETSTQTRWTHPKNATTQYYPREFLEEEKEALGQSKTLTEFLNSVSTSVEIALQQNEIMNTFIHDWKCLAEEESTFGDKTDTHLKEYQSFTDLHSLTEKMITCVSWHPVIYGLIAVSVAVRLSFEERVHFSGKLLLQPSLILFWSFSDPIHPQLMLESPDDIFCFQFCPTDPNIIAGGCINGQVVMWDITAHADRIENIKAGGSRSKKVTLKALGVQCLSRDSLEFSLKATVNPIHFVLSIHFFHAVAVRSAVFLSDSLAYGVAAVKEHDSAASRFAAASEGEVIYTDWKMEKDPETGRFMGPDAGQLNRGMRVTPRNVNSVMKDEMAFSIPTAKKPVSLYTVHDGAVHTVQRSPFYKDIILTVGGWNVAIWKEGIMTGPLLQSCCAPKRYTSGHWSLTRPGVFYIGREDGYIDIWDLLEKTHEPAQSQNICITMITYIKPWTFSAKQQFIAIADYYGTLHILEIPWTLSHPSTNEVSSISHYFEREVKHLDYVEQRKKIREQEKREMELELEKKKVKTFQKSKEQLEAELKMDYESYLELEKNILINLGLNKEKESMSYMELI
ncbi:hypothetical protein MJG53_001856 [Ovis ammon polii x Ovis aries]|uniref:Uncharacterized protein n=1 Tax=Ovis ammon polii x Ovis aries TaxID=2918886 RepID=A0ACB9VLJ2_9CETA|nr:hypothetical protein MJG53_001856 [Ovis ammon polii x Ovis aries]